MRNAMSVLLFFTVLCKISFAQDSFKPEDTEFKDTGYLLVQLRLSSGLSTNFKSAPDLYVGGVQVAGYIIPKPLVHVMRIGLIVEGFYTAKKLEAAVGPAISLKLKTFQSDPLGHFGSIGNIHLTLDHFWGTDRYLLFGGGIIWETDFLNLGLTSHRDYEHNRWWFQTLIGIQLSRKPPRPISVDLMPHNLN